VKAALLSVSSYKLRSARLSFNPAKKSFENEDFTVTTGIANTVRLGKWVPVTITPKRSQKITRVDVQTRDGADVPVTYEFKQESSKAGETVQIVVRFGRQCKSFRISVGTDDGATTNLVVPLVDTQILRSVQPLILTIESGGQIAQAVNDEQMQQISNDSQSVAKQVVDLSRLPNSWLAYDSIDTIFLTTDDNELLAKLSADQLTAIEQWVQRGGKLIISAAPEHSTEWFGMGQPLARFAPSPIKSTLQFSNSSRLENFAKSRKQLLKTGDTPIDIVDIKTSVAKVWVVDESTRVSLLGKATRI